jgi:hemoglobin-like flavoprotein
MGGAASISAKESIVDDQENRNRCVLFGGPCITDAALGDIINPLLMYNCRYVWGLVVGSANFDPDSLEAMIEADLLDPGKLGLFTADLLDRLALFPEVLRAFRPPRRTSRPTTQLARLVSYMLTIPDTTMATKKQLRALGRNHMRIGVSEEHFQVFAHSFLDAIMVRVSNSPCDNDRLRSWEILLKFVQDQFYFDKITFVNHVTKDSIISSTPRQVPEKPFRDLVLAKLLASPSPQLQAQRAEFSAAHSVECAGQITPRIESSDSSESSIQLLSPEEEEVLAGINFPLPTNERCRLRALRSIKVVDTVQDDADFASVLKAACERFKVSKSFVFFQW